MAGVDGWAAGSSAGGGFLVSDTRAQTGTQSLWSNNTTALSFYSVRHDLGSWIPAQGQLFVSVSLWISNVTEANRIYGLYLGSGATSTLGGTVLGLTIDGAGNIRAGTTWGNTYQNPGLIGTAAAGSFFDRWLTITLGFNPVTGEKTVLISGFGDGSTYSNTYVGGAAPANVNIGSDWFADSNHSGQAYFDNLVVVPEPTTYALLGLAAAGFAIRTLRRRKQKTD